MHGYVTLNVCIVHRENELNVVEWYIDTGDTPFHIEADLYIPGNIIFSDLQALLTSDGINKTVFVSQYVRWPYMPYREGKGMNATFSSITSFVQPDENTVYAADSNHGCVREIDRDSNQTKPLVGICEKTTYDTQPSNGRLLNSRFSKITAIAYHDNVMYIIEGDHLRIRKADLQFDRVTSIAAEEDFEQTYHNPREALVDPSRGQVYVSITYGMAQLDMKTDKFTYITHQESHGYKDGTLADSEWYWSTGLTMLLNDTLIVADANNDKLRVIDLLSNNVSTWCFNNTESSKPCSIRRPVPVHIYNCALYFGVYGRIARLKLPQWACEEAVTTDLPTST